MNERITAALDIISLLCDRQQKEMQNAMQENRDSISVIINDFLPCITIFYRVQMLPVKLLSYSSTLLLNATLAKHRTIQMKHRVILMKQRSLL